MSRKTKTIVLIYALILIVLYALPISVCDVGLYDGAGWLHHLTYQHFHASAFHLLCNIWAMLVFAFTVGTPTYKFIIAYALSATYPFAGDGIIIGASGLIYAVAGMYAFYGTTLRRFSQYNLFSIFTIMIGVFFFKVAVGLHAYCYLSGALFAFFFIPIRTELIQHFILTKLKSDLLCSS